MHVTYEKPDIERLRKEYMLVDMHFHSRYSHDCSTNVKSIIARCKKLGVHVAITDHNSIRGVLEAEKLSPGTVFPGVEVTTKEGKDVLVYFPTVHELTDFFMTTVQPHIKNKSSLRSGRTSLPIAQLFKALKNTKAFTVLPHPFAVGPRTTYQFLRLSQHAHLMQNINAIEVVNQAVPHRRNLAAIGWAMQCKKPMVGGSDGHIVGMLGSAFTCAKASDWEEFLLQIKRKNIFVVGEEKMLRHHVANLAHIFREKTKFLQNRKIRNGG